MSKTSGVGEWPEKVFLYLLLVALLVSVGAGLAFAHREATRNYSRALEVAEGLAENPESDPARYRPDVSLAYMLQFARAKNLDAIKGTALVVGTVVIVLGCMFTLYGAQAYLRLKLEQKEVRSALETSSPGLVLITLGTAIVVVSLMYRAEFTTNVRWAARQSEPDRDRAELAALHGEDAEIWRRIAEVDSSLQTKEEDRVVTTPSQRGRLKSSEAAEKPSGSGGQSHQAGEPPRQAGSLKETQGKPTTEEVGTRPAKPPGRRVDTEILRLPGSSDEIDYEKRARSIEAEIEKLQGKRRNGGRLSLVESARLSSLQQERLHLGVPYRRLHPESPGGGSGSGGLGSGAGNSGSGGR